MPYFKWSGVDIQGNRLAGRQFALSKKELDDALFKSDIALIKSSLCYPVKFLTRVSRADKTAFFSQLHVLVASGILLPEALTIVAQQNRHLILEEMLHAIALQVQEGEMLSYIAYRYPLLFDSLSIQLLTVGENNGSLAAAFEAVVQYHRVQAAFYTQLYAALFVPALTMIVFLLVLLFLFTSIIPHFAQMFSSMGSTLPSFTVTLLHISAYVTSWFFVLFLLAFLFAVVAAYYYFKKTEKGRKRGERILYALPYVGTFLTYQTFGYFFESVGLLLDGGIQLVPALIAVQKSISYDAFAQQMLVVIERVKHGNSFARALQVWDKKLISPDIMALIRIGSEIGALGNQLKQSACIYHAKVKRMLSLLTMVIQPFLIIVLGLCILFLLIAIYTPLLSISYTM